MGNKQSNCESNCNMRMQLLRQGFEYFDKMPGFVDKNNNGAMRVTMLITLHNENSKLKKMCGEDVQKKYIKEKIKKENEEYLRNDE